MTSIEPGEIERHLFGGSTKRDLHDQFPEPDDHWIADTRDDGTFVSFEGDWHELRGADDHRVHDTIRADEAITAGVHTTQGYHQSATKGFSWSNLHWEKEASNPLLTGPGTTDKGPCFGNVIHAATVLDDPVDEWYYYWAPYKGGGEDGIYLSTAPDITGPWTEGTRLFTTEDAGGGDHISSPWAVWDPDNERMNLYFHRAIDPEGISPQVSELVVSQDGLDFDLDRSRTILPAKDDDSWDAFERSYLKVVRWQGGWIGLYQGRDEQLNQHGTGWAHSEDGVNWDASPYPAFYNCHLTSADGNDGGGSPGIPFAVNGELTILLYAGNQSPPQAHALPWDQRRLPVSSIGEPLGLLPSQDWEKDDEGLLLETMIGPYRGRMWAFYKTLTPSDRHAIGLASAEV